MIRSFLTLTILMVALSGCNGFFEKDPEIKSPCVAAESNNTHGQHPCARRPANAAWIG